MFFPASIFSVMVHLSSFPLFLSDEPPDAHYESKASFPPTVKDDLLNLFQGSPRSRVESRRDGRHMIAEQAVVTHSQSTVPHHIGWADC